MLFYLTVDILISQMNHMIGIIISLFYCSTFEVVEKLFLDFETYFHDVLCKFSCIVLNETWLTEEYENVFLINGFKTFDSYRSSNGGGIRLYVKNLLNVNILSHFNVINDLCEMLIAEIFVGSKKIVLCCLYHPPSSDHSKLCFY